MTSLLWNCSFRCLLATFAAGALSLMMGCSENIPLLTEDISGHVWLQEVSDEQGVKGFYASEDGQLKLINHPDADGVYWEVNDNRLLLWFRNQGHAKLRWLEYHPLLINDDMFLSRTLESGSLTYSAAALEEPLETLQYVPITLLGSPAENMPLNGHEPYLQIDTADKSLRGYGGVNNFHGGYQGQGPVGFKTHWMSATKMSGPGMDYEVKFMQCLDRADSLIAVRREIFLYEGSQLVCSLRAK